MFKKILVPLDGSKLAECALSYAKELALISKADRITLISVTERKRGVTFAEEAQKALMASQDTRLGERSIPEESLVMGSTYPVASFPNADTLKRGVSITFGKLEKQAQKYLNRIAKQFEKENIPVSTEVLIGKVAEEISKFAEDNMYDVIVMSSHGRSGPSRWTMGSITDKVFRSACIPILVVRAPGCFPELKKKK
jgi:nucleotide-binding universal stress UspA family protein